MPLLHDHAYREQTKTRLRALRPDATRQWGKMTVDLMLWHVNCGLADAMGRFPMAPVKVPLPKGLRLLDEFGSRSIDAAWPDSAFLGPMKGHDWSRLQAKHVDHHLKQFGV